MNEINMIIGNGFSIFEVIMDETKKTLRNELINTEI